MVFAQVFVSDLPCDRTPPAERSHGDKRFKSAGRVESIGYPVS